MDRSDILRILMPERTKQVALAWSILRDSAAAEDAYQDMLAKVFEKEQIFEGPRHLRDWSWKGLRNRWLIVSVGAETSFGAENQIGCSANVPRMRNRCYELVRRQKFQTVLLDDAVLELVDGELEGRDAEGFDQQADALRDCLETLTQNAREIIRLRFFEGLRANQVAEKLSRKPDAVYKTLQRSYAALGECIRLKLAHAEPGETTS